MNQPENQVKLPCAVRMGVSKTVPDEHTLAVVSFPEASVALVGHGEDVRREFAEVMSTVQLYG